MKQFSEYLKITKRLDEYYGEDFNNTPECLNFLSMLSKKGYQCGIHQSEGLIHDIDVQDALFEYIFKEGFGSLFNRTSAQESIIFPSYNIDVRIEIIKKFSSQLNGAIKVVITDPYIYVKNQNLILFEEIFKTFMTNLEEIIFIANKQQNSKNDIHQLIKTLKPNIKITDIQNDDFHDRFWISLDKKIGFVMGTSLNGMGKKLR